MRIDGRRPAFASAVLSMATWLAFAPAAHASPDQVGSVDTSTGEWHLTDPGGGSHSFWYGIPGDVPLVGDWNCDGIDTPGMYRRSNGFVYLRNSNTTGVADISFFYGNPSDIPLAGDWDGDCFDTLAIYRPSEGRVYLSNALGTRPADQDYLFGNPGDVPFAGDFDADGKDEIGLRRPSSGLVYLNFDHDSAADLQFVYGDLGDQVLAGDWDGDGDQTVAIYRPATCTFYLSDTNGTGVADRAVEHGTTSMAPVAGTFGLAGGAPRSFVCSGPTLWLGNQGPWVQMLNTALAQAHFRPGGGDVFNVATQAAVMAFQKYHGLTRDGVFRSAYWDLLGHQPVAPSRPTEPDRVEVDIGRQILMLVRNHQVTAVLPISSGNGELFYNQSGQLVRAVTPRGDFTFVWNVTGLRVSYLGELWNPFYFYGGYAVHGSPSVPPYPASHGCIRVTMWDMDWLKYQIWVGMPMHVYG
ncbi:MAG: L,D-transpeptidase family protein [Acidimicrobiia bacterium]